MTVDMLMQQIELYYDQTYNPVQRSVIRSYIEQRVDPRHFRLLFAEVVRAHPLRIRCLPGVAAFDEVIREHNATCSVDDRIRPPERQRLPDPEDEDLIPFRAGPILARLAAAKHLAAQSGEEGRS